LIRKAVQTSLRQGVEAEATGILVLKKVILFGYINTNYCNGWSKRC